MTGFDSYSTARLDSPLPDRHRRARVSRLRPLTDEERDLASEHYHLVGEVARRLARRFPPSLSESDRESAGAVGLMSAVRAWRPDGGSAFETFARRRIRGAIFDEARAALWAPRAARREGVSVTMGTFGLDPDPGGVAHDCVDPRPDCDAGRAAVEAADELRAVLARAEVEDREVELLVLHAHGLTLSAAGRRIGLSESRACQLRARALNKIRWWHGLRRVETRERGAS